MLFQNFCLSLLYNNQQTKKMDDKKSKSLKNKVKFKYITNMKNICRNAINNLVINNVNTLCVIRLAMGLNLQM